MKDLQWFTDRIGKTIYRTSCGCDCVPFYNADARMIIEDEADAKQLYKLEQLNGKSTYWDKK